MSFNINFNDKTIGIIVVILIFIGLTALSSMTEGFSSQTQTQIQTNTQTPGIKVNWAQQSANNLPLLIREFGYPDVIDPNQGGISVWKKITLNQRGFCWDQIILNDDPANYISITYAFPLLKLRGEIEIKKALGDLCDFHPAVHYDQTDQALHVKANSIQQSIILLTLAKRLLSKEITLQQANNLIKPLTASVNSKSPSYDPNAYNKFKIELCSVGLPLANSLGELPSSEIYTLRPGGMELEIKNMSVY